MRATQIESCRMSVLQIIQIKMSHYYYLKNKNHWTDLHMHRYPLVCWQSCGKVQVQLEELPVLSQSPLLYLRTKQHTVKRSYFTKHKKN